MRDAFIGFFWFYLFFFERKGRVSNFKKAVKVGVVPHDFSGVERFVVVVEVEAGFVGVDSYVVVPTNSVDDAFDGVVVDSAGDQFAASVYDQLIDVGIVFVEVFESFFAAFVVGFVGGTGRTGHHGCVQIGFAGWGRRIFELIWLPGLDVNLSRGVHNGSFRYEKVFGRRLKSRLTCHCEEASADAAISRGMNPRFCKSMV
jgi:hypothetical protein